MTIIIDCAVSVYMTASYLLRPMTRKAPMTIIIDCAVSVYMTTSYLLRPMTRKLL